MNDTNSKDPLLSLFSTRSRGGNSGSTEAAVQASERKAIADNTNSNTGTIALPNSSTRQSSSDSSSSSSANKNNNHHNTVSKNELSPLANLILREARRELGSELNQSGEKAVPSEAVISEAVDRVIKRRGQDTLDDIERANVIIHLQKDLLGWGVLQPLVDNKEVTDIHVYDYKTVVLQRGKVSEATGLRWASHANYVAFIDRLLLRLGKSLTNSQHTVDCSFNNGIRICAVHESVCGQRGPLLSIRIPRMSEVTLENIVTYQVAPPLIVDYLAALTRCGHVTMMIAGETGTGKTTLMKCLGTQFGENESIVAVEDTPEVNFQHSFFRSLVSRPPNVEGLGEVTLQEHIKTTLRMTPTRVILGEMRSPQAAEAFLESAQTGHTGMSTVHARNARETLTRLESLLGRAQKSVAIDIIRQQIALAVDLVIWLFRDKETGKPRIGEIVEVGNFTEGVISVRPMFKLIEYGSRPVWRLESWSSQFDDVLLENGIKLGESPQEFSFGPIQQSSGSGVSRRH